MVFLRISPGVPYHIPLDAPHGTPQRVLPSSKIPRALSRIWPDVLSNISASRVLVTIPGGISERVPGGILERISGRFLESIPEEILREILVVISEGLPVGISYGFPEQILEWNLWRNPRRRYPGWPNFSDRGRKKILDGTYLRRRNPFKNTRKNLGKI